METLVMLFYLLLILGLACMGSYLLVLILEALIEVISEIWKSK